MALTATQKVKLKAVLFESAGGAIDVVLDELWLAFFENAAQRTARAQGWIAVVRDARQGARDGVDAAAATKKTTLDADLADLDAVSVAV